MNAQNNKNQTNTKPMGTISVDYVPPVPCSKKQAQVKDNDDFIPYEEVK